MNTKKIFIHLVMLSLGASLSSLAAAGPYPPAAQQPDSTAINKDDAAFVSWAASWEDYIVGDQVTSTFQVPEKALGPAEGNSFDIVSLGRGGSITLTFEAPIRNGPGWDFAVFENSFSDTFLELAYVEVSSDGVNFVRFDNDSLTPNPVGGSGAVDPTDINGVAGKYRQGFGTPFDLQDLISNPKVREGLIDLSSITHVRIVDIVGDGTSLDTSGDVIYDPFPTTGSAGFDLDAVGVINQTFADLFPPDPPTLLSPADGQGDVPLSQTLMTGPFIDGDRSAGDFHSESEWQVSISPNFLEGNLVIDVNSPVNLTSLTFPNSILANNTTYYWRIRFFDSFGISSGWSDTFSFTTTATSEDSNSNGIPDSQELEGGSAVDLDGDDIPDALQIDEQFKVLHTVKGNGQMGIRSSDSATIQYAEAINPTDLPDIPSGSKPHAFLLSLITFRVVVQNPGDEVTFRVFLSEPAPSDYRWFQFNLVDGWNEVQDAVFTGDRSSITLTIRDGGEQDLDGIANGIIIDPSGVGRFAGGSSPPPSGSAGIGGGPCFIATAAYGSGMTEEVITLKQFRDKVLMRFTIGRLLVKGYYHISPPVANYLRRHDGLRKTARIGLVPVVFVISYPRTFAVLGIVGILGLCLTFRARKKVVKVKSH